MTSPEGDGTTHLFSKTNKKTGQKCFSGYWLVGLMMKAPENGALLIDAIIFLQNNVSLSMLLHPPEDPRPKPHSEPLQGEIIPPTLRTARGSLMIVMRVRADVEVAHQLSIGLEQGGLLLLQKRQFRLTREVSS